jgi:hypothetical protein
MSDLNSCARILEGRNPENANPHTFRRLGLIVDVSMAVRQWRSLREILGRAKKFFWVENGKKQWVSNRGLLNND